MRKIIFIILVLCFVSACTSVKDSNLREIIDTISTNPSKINIIRKNYSYYLPQNYRVISYGENYEVIKHNNDYFYFYIDTLSYFKKSSKPYIVDNTKLISYNLSNLGYIEVNNVKNDNTLLKNDKNFIEIMYNFAKIEVIVDVVYRNAYITDAMIILSSIKFNDSVIEKKLSDDDVKIVKTIDIFTPKEKTDNYLKVED